MTTFNNGPARGKVLRLKRAPFFLRIAVEDLKVDALDLPEDTPLPTERLFAYKLTELPGMCHIRAARGQGGFFATGNYTLVDPQPPEAQMRERDQWVAWCEANKALADSIFK